MGGAIQATGETGRCDGFVLCEDMGQVKEQLKSDVLRKEGAGHGGVHLSSHHSGGRGSNSVTSEP